MTKHEERRLMKKYSQPDEPEESALAQTLKAAMNQSSDLTNVGSK